MTRRYGGTGLGLAISRRIVEMMGGRIGVDSQPGQGSCFWFEAPFAPGNPQLLESSSSAKNTLQKLAVHRGQRILLAEDNRVNQEVARELLQDGGLQVEVADDGQIALEMAARAHYDLILMDVQMPVMDGLEATWRIRQLDRYRETPILAMTASAFADERQQCLQAGMSDHIAKPVDPERLYEALVQWLPMPQTDKVQEPPASSSIASVAVDQGLLDRLRGVAGLQVDAGLRTVRGKWPTYLRLLEQFVRYHRDDAGRARHSLAQNQLEETQRIAHSLKGVAASLGLLTIGERAADLERAMREERPAAECLALIEALERELETSVDDLDRVLPEPETAPSLDAGMIGADVGAVLRELTALLNEDDLNAVSYYQQRAGLIIPALGERSAALAAHIEQYQFQEALKILEAAQELHSSPSSSEHCWPRMNTDEHGLKPIKT